MSGPRCWLNLRLSTEMWSAVIDEKRFLTLGADFSRFLSLFLVLVANSAFGEKRIREDLEALYAPQKVGDADLISLAAGYSQPLVRAPAIATVITRKDIEKLGATTLAEVLATVPGLYVSTARGLNDIFVIRGFFDQFNTYVLLLLNGIPVNNIVNGGRPQAWRMPVHNISRIEIMRGPGSALYGADAAAGVINIITKTANEINGTEVGAYAGSFETYGGWLQSSGQWGDIEAALSLEVGTTEGYRKIVAVDDQTRIDQLLGTQASLAPGPINTQRDDLDARLDVNGERWRFRAGYLGFLNVGTGVGTTLALDPSGDFSVGLTNADFTYDLLRSDPWDIAAQISYLGTTTEASLVPFPPGAFGVFSPRVFETTSTFGSMRCEEVSRPFTGACRITGCGSEPAPVTPDLTTSRRAGILSLVQPVSPCRSRLATYASWANHCCSANKIGPYGMVLSRTSGGSPPTGP